MVIAVVVVIVLVVVVVKGYFVVDFFGRCITSVVFLFIFS